MFNPLPDHFQQSAREAIPPFARPYPNARRPKATAVKPSHVVATSAPSLRMTPATTV
jgi:hypothetical protein